MKFLLLSAVLLLLGTAAAQRTATQQQTPECHQCYTLVERAVEEYRRLLAKLDGLLQTIGTDLSSSEDREFQRQISILRVNIKDLNDDARRAVLRGSSPLLLLGDLQERIEVVKREAGTLLVFIDQSRLVTGQCDRTITEAEQIIARLEAALKGAFAYLNGEGQDALLLAIKQSQQFGLQSAQMSQIAREARQLAERHEQEAKALISRTGLAVSNSTAAYQLAYTLLEQQTNYSSEIGLLTASLTSTELLVAQTRELAQQAQREAAEVYENAFNLYTEARAGFGRFDVDGLKRSADYLKADAQRLKSELEELTIRHGPMLDGLQKDISSLKILIERGFSQQMAANELMVDVTAARDKARQAVAAGEQTLAEAQKTLETLLRFDRQVQESRELAQAALSRVSDILAMVELAESQTRQAGLALQGADRDAAVARDGAGEAEGLAEEAYQEVVRIKTETAFTSERAAALRAEASRTSTQISETTISVERYERQVTVDSALAREALEKAGLAAGNARDAQTRVEAALKLLQELLAQLASAGDLDLAALEQLERRLAAAEAQLNEAELLTKMEEFRRHRIQQDRMVKDYEKELEFLRQEVYNVRDIAEALPTGCYNRITLEP
ncbi:laminin subunit gamma-1-like [Amphibalanus amphitrite]|uniref:laminin subunit gamma-1-like n=1 Tax=Amphibalanus amphitrite TaxID=1232801 RepID=UPI001C925EBD|nr:laminin subunit gamma-1-like [Amphibalanus amphitrite]